MLAEIGAAGSQEAFNNAIWQYPVAALLLLVVGMFLRHLTKSEERNQADRRQLQSSFTEALKSDREELSTALDRMGERHQSISESFNRTMSEATAHHSTMQAQIIDALAAVKRDKDG